MVKFQDPPPEATQPRKQSRHTAVAAQLKENPGKWALLEEVQTRSSATMIRRGNHKAYQPDGSFEAVAQARSDGAYDVYARYIGENGEHR